MKNIVLFTLLISNINVFGQYAPAAGTIGTTAIHKDSSIIVNWATSVHQFTQGYLNAASPSSGYADFGEENNALGAAEGNSSDVVSLGDGGSIILAFDNPLKNGEGPDFAVYENSFDDTFLELAHIEVSTDGVRFVRIPSNSNTQTANQVGSFGSSDPTKLKNLAGKYKQAYGTPFDLNDIIDSTGVNLDSINFIKVIDVVGSINQSIGSKDSHGNLINDPYPTQFASGGFDLDAIAVIHENKTLGISASNSTLDFSLYPNPTIDSFKIKSSSNGLIEIYSTNGKLIYSKQIAENEILTVNGLSTGLYIVNFTSNLNLTTKKIFVNR